MSLADLVSEQIEENSFGLWEADQLLQMPNVDVYAIGDSLGTFLDDRMGPYFAWVMEDRGGSLPTRVGGGADDKGSGGRFGIGLENSFTSPSSNRISATDTIPYASYSSGSTLDTIVSLCVAAKGINFQEDGATDFTTSNGKQGRFSRITAQAFQEPSGNPGLTTAGALAGVIQAGTSGNSVIAHLLVQAGTAGLSEREVEVYDGTMSGSPVGSFTPSVDIAGYPHLGEDPSSARAGGAPANRMARISESFVLTEQITNGTLQGYMADATATDDASNTGPNTGKNTTYTGIILEKESDGSWVGGSSLIGFGGSSTSLDNWANDDEPSETEDGDDATGTTNAKNVSVDGIKHAIGATGPENQEDRPVVALVCMAVEGAEGGESTAEYQTRIRGLAGNILDNVYTSLLANGRRAIRVVFVETHYQRARSLSLQQAWAGGISEAVRDRPQFASHFCGPAILGWTDPDGSSTWTDYLTANSVATLQSFGNVTDGDISGDLVDDDTHYTDEVAVAFFAKVFALGLASARRIQGGGSRGRSRSRARWPTR